MKVCSKCKLSLDLVNFSFDNYHNKYRNDCKKCVSSHRATYKKNNVQKVRQANKRCYQNNKKELKDKARLYEKITTNIKYKLSRKLRDRFRKAIKGKYKKGSVVKNLGCSVEFFRSYIENQFKSGISWDNYGKWHLDHIKPLSKFNLENVKELKEAYHYSNLQPLWAEENTKKVAKYE